MRFVGDARQRIAEDVLRLLRWFRFHAHYGRPPPDAEALETLAAAARTGIVADNFGLERISMGMTNDFEVEVPSGLAEGDRVIVAPESSLTDGSRVENR